MYIVRISDGLGNQISQYAFAKKLQLLTGKQVYLDTRYINNEDIYIQGKRDWFHEKCDYRSYGLNNFRITLSVVDKQKLSRLWFYRYWDEEVKTFKKNLPLFPTYFKGYFFDLKYFDDIRYILQREIRLKTPIYLPSELQKVLKTENTVGVHIRRGDFLKLSRDLSQSKYYPKALEKIEEYIQDPVYLVFSDDIEWVKENIKIDSRKVYVSDMGFSDYEELMIMKHCKHNIIANSTFSYWGAYLNDNSDKIVICPKRWKTAIIPREWICI